MINIQGDQDHDSLAAIRRSADLVLVSLDIIKYVSAIFHVPSGQYLQHAQILIDINHGVNVSLASSGGSNSRVISIVVVNW